MVNGIFFFVVSRIVKCCFSIPGPSKSEIRFTPSENTLDLCGFRPHSL